MDKDIGSRTPRRVGTAGAADEQPPIDDVAAQGANAPHAPRKKNPRNKKKKEKKPIGKTTRIVLLSLLALVLLGGGALAVMFHQLANNPAAFFQDPTPAPTQAPTPVVTAAPGATPTPTPEPTPDPEQVLLSEADLEFMKNRINVLALGIDESTEREHWGSFRTDTMILISIDFDTHDVTMISLPRDSFVKICNAEGGPLRKGEAYVYGKINSAFPTGGGSKKNGYGYAMGTVSYVLGGIPVQYYVGFNMNVVKDIVNAMGGLEYEVDTKVSMNGREYEPGLQYLDGQGVLDYCRQRKGSSDIARVDRQQRMLKAIFHEMKKTDQIKNIPEIYGAVQANIETNLTTAQIAALALLAMRMDFDQLNSYTLDGSFLNMKSTSYWGLYTGKIQTMVQEIYGISVSVDSELNVTNIREQIEANRQLIATELATAKAALDTAQAILSGYGDYITDDAKSRLKAAISHCEDAYEEEDKALLDYYTPPLQQINNELLQGLAQAGILAGGGQVYQPQAPQEAFPDIPEAELPVGG